MANFLNYGPDEDELDNRANQMNPEHDDYNDDYMSNSYDTDDHSQDENDNRADQMNPNNSAYDSSRR